MESTRAQRMRVEFETRQIRLLREGGEGGGGMQRLLQVPWMLLLIPRAAAEVREMQIGDEFAVPGGCRGYILGCYFDKIWDDCRFLPANELKCVQSPSYKSGRDIPYFLPGCFSDPEKSGKTAPNPPPCDPKTLTMEKCAAACAAWAPRIPGADDGEVWAAVQGGMACACGNSDEAHAALKTDATNVLKWGDCSDKCAGDPGQSCGAGGRNTIVRVECGAEWGTEFMLLIFFGVGVFYVGGGVAWAAKMKGAAPALRLHPHFSVWVEVHALVVDGVELARGKGSGRGSGGRGTAGGGTQSDTCNRRRLLESGAGASPPAGASPSAAGQEKKSKSKSKSSKKNSGNDRLSSPPKSEKKNGEPTDVTDLMATTADGTPAGGGGRWIHMPG